MSDEQNIVDRRRPQHPALPPDPLDPLRRSARIATARRMVLETSRNAATIAWLCRATEGCGPNELAMLQDFVGAVREWKKVEPLPGGVPLEQVEVDHQQVTTFFEERQHKACADVLHLDRWMASEKIRRRARSSGLDASATAVLLALADEIERGDYRR